MTVMWMVTPTRLIPVTVDTFDTPKRCQNPKPMKVTWMVTPTRLILATVDTLDTLTYQRSQSCCLPYLIFPRSARVADAEIFVASKKSKRHPLNLQHFQLLRRILVTFSNTRSVVIYSVGCLSRIASVKNSAYKSM